MFRKIVLSLTAALVLGAAMPVAPAKADGLFLEVYGKELHRRKGEKRYWHKGDRLRAGRYNKMLNRRAMREHYPYNCYWSGRNYRVSSRDYYGDWYRKSIWRPVHRCR